MNEVPEWASAGRKCLLARMLFNLSLFLYRISRVTSRALVPLSRVRRPSCELVIHIHA